MAARVKTKPTFMIEKKGRRKRSSSRKVDEKYLMLIRALPCASCKSEPAGEAAHIRMADAKHKKPITGMQIRPDDEFVMPLCAEHHRLGNDAQHSMNERKFWEGVGIPDPVGMAKTLYANKDDFMQMRRIIITNGNSA